MSARAGGELAAQGATQLLPRKSHWPHIQEPFSFWSIFLAVHKDKMAEPVGPILSAEL